MNKQFLIVANWKMQLSYNQAVEFCTQHFQELDRSLPDHVSVVLCPSFEALYPIGQLLAKTSLKLGAQTCSNYKMGAYTGEVCAESLAQLGCTHCIIGHSERRSNFGETSNDIAIKTTRLLEQGIRPIICIGETLKEHQQGLTIHALHDQLEPVLQKLAAHPTPAQGIIIAYEPVWAIGTGQSATPSYLNKIFTWLDQLYSTILPMTPCTLLYGGSVNEQTAADIARIDKVQGLLLGGASLDFQKFKNIVSLVSK